MARMPKKPAPASRKTIEAIQHADAKRKNIPTAEYQAVLKEQEKDPIRVQFDRRNRDLDPQLMWRGKDEQDWEGVRFSVYEAGGGSSVVNASFEVDSEL